MKKAVLLLIILVNLSCHKKQNEYYLYHSLKGYSNKTKVNQEFFTGYKVDLVGFFKEANHKQLTILLDKNTTDSIVENYKMAIHIFNKESRAFTKKGFYICDTSPSIHTFGESKYLINGISIPGKKIDSIILFLYDKKGFDGIKGEKILLKNINF